MQRYHFQKDMFQFLTLSSFLTLPPKPRSICITLLALTLIFCNRLLLYPSQSCFTSFTIKSLASVAEGKQISLPSLLVISAPPRKLEVNLVSAREGF